MNILYACLNPAQHSLRAALDKQGNVTQINWREMHPMELSLAMVTGKYDVAFLQIQSPGVLDLHALQILKSSGCYIINYTGDVREPLPDWYKEVAPYCDVTCFTNYEDVMQIQAIGYNAQYIREGYESHVFFTQQGIDKKIDVAFIGSNYNERFPQSNLRKQVVNWLLRSSGLKVSIQGRSWPHPIRPINFELQGDVFRQSLVALDMPHFNRQDYHGDRKGSILASGCLPVRVTDFNEFTSTIHDIVRNAKYDPIALAKTAEPYKWDVIINDLFKRITHQP